MVVVVRPYLFRSMISSDRNAFLYVIGSKKSAPIRMIKESCEAVELLDGIPVKNSSINASVNMESLCCELERKSNIVQVKSELFCLIKKCIYILL